MKFTYVSEIENDTYRKANIVVLAIIIIVFYIPLAAVPAIYQLISIAIRDFVITVKKDFDFMIEHFRRMWKYKP